MSWRTGHSVANRYEGPPYCHTSAWGPVLVGLHHIGLSLTSWVVECNTVHSSPGIGGSARPSAADVIAKTAVTVTHARDQGLLMMTIPPKPHADPPSTVSA
ncbi:hypothetical protein A5738_16215 [Mycobacterium colombiense]|nr:hypothetical protein A5738_16215 [Mycobacterium colombiense]